MRENIAATPNPVDGIASLQRFLTRQPILNNEHVIIGYELKRRDPAALADDALPGVASRRQAEDEWLLASTIDLAYQRALGDKLTFLGVAPETLLSPLMEQLPKNQVVIAIHPHLSSPTLIGRTEQLAHDGLQLALDDPGDNLELAGYCRYIRFDTTRYDVMGLTAQVVRSLNTGSKKKPLLIATQVDTPEVFAACRKLSFNLFQGYYYTYPQASGANRLDSGSIRVMELLNLARKQADFSEIEKSFKLDPGLTYRLLRYINSPAIGMRRTIESISHALILLGHDQIYRWLTLLLFTSQKTDPRSQSLLRSALVRARFIESLGRDKLKRGESDSLFIVGIFSLLDALLNIPMRQALDGLHLPPPVMDALVDHTGPYAPYLNLALACEHFDQETIATSAAEIGIDADEINLAHVNALIWSESLDI
jgi:EAL and modified HD-GYP domain-containing signal transduction protein